MAQPGWQDLTARYYYAITDKDGKEISFNQNKQYTITINSVSYQAPHIPNDSLPTLIDRQNFAFDDYIRINDLSLRLARKDRLDGSVSIKIAYKKDTMYLNQPTGKGTLCFNTLNGQKSSPVPDRRLQFIPGHYYFPKWTSAAFDNIPQVSGSVRIVNARQANFLIPKALSDALFTPDNNAIVTPDLELEAETLVLRHFTDGYFSVAQESEKTKVDISFAPYKSLWGFKVLHATKDPNQYIGLMQYTLDTLNLSLTKYVFATFDKKENAIRHWYPKNDLNLFYCEALYVDSFTQRLYQVLAVREQLNAPCTVGHDEACPYNRTVLLS
ncbi:hypothetical protein DBR32_14020 [Taibaiella sp. KBW10]|nr:hypothetical protein DBR32_14020 [Taibaiella sp. KBW10]